MVSGSVSPTTERQIRHAIQNGFDGIALDAVALAATDPGSALEDAVARGLASLEKGRSVLLYTALGPSADRGDAIPLEDGSRHRIGERLGSLLRELVTRAGLRRAVVAGEIRRATPLASSLSTRLHCGCRFRIRRAPPLHRA